MKNNKTLEIEEELRDLEQELSRLRVFYEQYFMGTLKREPQDLRARVQRRITKIINDPPRNTGQKFKLHQLNSRYQSYRNHWGRILREIEAGTYAPHRFRARMRAVPEAASPRAADPDAPSATGPIAKLAKALSAARLKTGEGGDVSAAKMASAVRKQTSALREKYGKGKISFKVVVENNRARLKATMKRGQEEAG